MSHTHRRDPAHSYSHTHTHAIPRRQFLTAAVGMVAGVATGLRDQTAFAARPHALGTQQGWDILIRGGRVVDPSQDLNGRYDIAIREGKIAQVAPTIDPTGWREVIDVDGRIVTPGFVDLHAHVYEGVSHYGINAALLHGPEQIADLPVPVAESPGAVRIGHPERSHLVEYLAPNSVFNSLPRQRSSPHLRPDDRLVTIDRVLHHASLGVA